MAVLDSAVLDSAVLDSPVVPIRRALLSVSDKTGLLDLAHKLDALGIVLISTGGTHRLLCEAGIRVSQVSDITGFPEIMNGRIKTLHPKIHGGLLGRRGVDDEVMAQHAIEAIDLLIVNLYPFEEASLAADSTLDKTLENIDIGGPALLRAAAKNHAYVTAVTDPNDYAELLDTLTQNNGTYLALRRRLAAKAFAHTARYDGLIADYLSTRVATESLSEKELFPCSLQLGFERAHILRYGENPHQKAALYTEHQAPTGVIATARLLTGKELSFNNIADADTALECVKAFKKTPACVIVKHANPCGVALGANVLEAYERAYATDPTSAFGGIIAFNQPLDRKTAQAILERQFVEVIIAPEIDNATFEVFSKKPNVRLLVCGNWPEQTPTCLEYHCIAAGLLVQEADRDALIESELQIVSKLTPDAATVRDLLFAWRVAMFVKSNAIVYAHEGRTIGIGAGQTSRVISAQIATLKAQQAGLTTTNAVLASDAFFPFRDGIDVAAAAGIRAVIQPGGSLRDKEVIAAADQHHMIMAMTGVRHFRH